MPVQTAEEDFILKTTSAEEVDEPELLPCAKLSRSCQVSLQGPANSCLCDKLIILSWIFAGFSADDKSCNETFPEICMF